MSFALAAALLSALHGPCQEQLERLIQRLGSDNVAARERALEDILSRWKEWADADLARLDRASGSSDKTAAHLAAEAAARVRIRHAVGDKLLSRVKDIDRRIYAGGDEERLAALGQVRTALHMREIKKEQARAVGRFAVPLLESPNRKVWSDAFSLVITLEARDTIPALVRLLRAPEPYLRGTAAWTLGRLGAQEHAESLAGLLADSERSVVANAIRGLGQLGRKEDIPRVAPWIQDPDRMLREAAVEALGDLGATNHTGSVVRLLEDSEEGVRSMALLALGQLGAREHSGKVVPFLKVQEGTERHSALRALCLMGAADRLDDAIQFLKEEHADFTFLVWRMLEGYGTADHARPVVAMLKDLSGAGAIAAFEALADIGRPEHAGVIAPHLKSASEEVLPSVFRALGRLAASEHLKLLEESLARPETTTRGLAAFALAQAATRAHPPEGRGDVVRRLEALGQDKEEFVRQAAAVGLVRLGRRDRPSQRELLSKVSSSVSYCEGELIDALNEVHEPGARGRFEQAMETKQPLDSMANLEGFFKSVGLELSGKDLRRLGRIPAGVRTSPRRALFSMLDDSDVPRYVVLDGNRVRLVDREEAVEHWLKRLGQ